MRFAANDRLEARADLNQERSIWYQGRKPELRCDLRRGLLRGLDLNYTCANSSLAKIMDKANFRPVILLIVPSVSTALCIDLGGRAVSSTLRCIQSLVGYDY